MKIKTDFVTNSSTTSFIITSKEKPEYEDLASLFGLKGDSPMKGLVASLLDSLRDSMTEIVNRENQAMLRQDLEAELRTEVPEEIMARATDALATGKRIWAGRLSSENNDVETFFCLESFEWENDTLYIDGLECGW